MSDEPKRFDSVIEMLTHDCHKYALENARLKAEVERLRASSFVTAVPVEEYEKLKAEVERLTDENTRLTMMKDAFKRMIKRRDKWILEQKTEVERLNGCQMIEATYVVSPEDAERIRRRLEREKGGQP